MYQISSRVRSIPNSPALEIDSKTKELINRGIDVINLSIGEPYFESVDGASMAGIKAIATGFTKYTPAAGITELRKAIRDKLLAENELSYNIDEIMVSNGAKHSLFNVFMTILEPGDEIIIPSPYWITYPHQADLAGARTVLIETDESTEYKITPELLQQAITSRTKALLLNYPSNPTGAVYTKEELLDLVAVIEQHDFYIVSDEIYEKLIYEGEHISFASLSKSIKERTILVNGFSKAFAMTGWRLGYVAGPAPIIKAMTAFQSQATGSVSSISQKAGSVAFKYFNPLVIEEHRKRLEYVCSRLFKMPFLSFQKPSGAFYIFPNVEKVIGREYQGERIETIEHFCQLLLDHALVSTVPGSVFGSHYNFRLSFSTSMENLEKAMDRLEKFLNTLK